MRVLSGKIKQFIWDVSGAFGDIGVLFPIAIALIAKNGFNPTALFLTAGIFYIASAYYFKITMPVQPLKAMSAIAIATGLSSEIINSAGIVMGIILLGIAFTGLSVKLGRIFPVSVIRGIQLGLGMMLTKTSLSLMNDDISTAAIVGIILMVCIFIIKRIPPLIPVMILGIALSLKEVKTASIGPMALTLNMPDLNNLWIGLTLLVLPQIGLTFGNAIVATEATGKILYGNKSERLNLKSIPLSMGIANIASGIMGGAPMCHGSGGITAHYKFGATSERSGYIIGFSLVSLALLFGSSALSIVSAFPKSILGVLLCYVGVQHSLFIKDILKDRTAVMVASATAVLGFLMNNLTIGFLTGIVMHYVFIGFSKTLKYLEK
jgi:SulP family sulfate permease